METWEIEETLSRTRLRPPKTIYVLSAPIIYPQRSVLVLGLNPRRERETAVLGSNATRETVIHETLHRMGLGEIVTRPLAKVINVFREVFPANRRASVRYQERILSSSELESYGLKSYLRVNGYVPAELSVRQLNLVE